MRNGHVFRRVLWEPATDVTAGGLLPTPVAQTSQGGPKGLDGGAGARQMLADAGFPRCTGAPTAMPIGPDGTPGLPTPSACVANDGERPETWLARREKVKQTAKNGNGMGMPLTIAAQMLPTPRTCSAMAARLDTAGNAGPKRFPNLETVAAQLLPTPTANDSRNGTLPPAAKSWDSLPGAILRDDSIPTGGPTYLSPSFVAEMMGYPIEWLD